MATAPAENITAEQFFEEIAKIDRHLPAKLRAFITQLAPLGIYPDYQQSVNLKWERPSGKPINLGYITRKGQVWTDVATSSVAEPWAKELAHRTGWNWELGVSRGSPRSPRPRVNRLF
jgi:hypothetical protein